MNPRLRIFHAFLPLVSSVLFTCALLVGPVNAQLLEDGEEDSGVKATLIADSATVKPGESFRVAVQFEIAEPWHIYWKNPGDTGLPTKITISGPPGFEVSEVAWPTPARFRQVGGMLGYGYAHTALFIAQVQAPKDLRLGTDVDIGAFVEWLACSDVCVRGSDNLSIMIPVRNSTSPRNEKLFREWEQKLPRELGGESDVQAVVQGSVSKSGIADNQFKITVAAPVGATNVDWYPNTPKSLSVERVNMLKMKNEYGISFTVKRLSESSIVPAEMESVLALTVDGVERSYRVPVALR